MGVQLQMILFVTKLIISIFQSKVIRVLNLWQKNEVFTSDVIQPLFDLANPNSDLAKQMDDQAKRGLLGGSGSGSDKPSKTPMLQIAPETQTQNRQSSQQQQSDDQVGHPSGRSNPGHKHKSSGKNPSTLRGMAGEVEEMSDKIQYRKFLQ